MGRGESKLQRRERYLRKKERDTQGGTLKENEAAAAEWYVSGEGMWINQYLRGRGDFGELSDSEKQYLKDLDSATNRKLKPQTLYRSTDASAIFGDMDDYDYSDMRTVLVYGQDAFGKGDYAKSKVDAVNRRVQEAKGKTITEKGFMSTTKSEQIAQDFFGFTGSTKSVVMKIRTKPSTQGADISQFDKNVAPEDAQQEVLLRRNQSYTITDIYSKDRNIYVDVEMR